MLYTVSQTAIFLCYTALDDLFQIFYLCRRFEVAAFIAANNALENFIFVSVFMGAYRSFQIMNAKNGLLGPCDIFKLYIRKFIRLAPAYYSMWLILWVVTARIADGPIWYFSNMTFGGCKEKKYWIPAALMGGNVYPNDMEPYHACY